MSLICVLKTIQGFRGPEYSNSDHGVRDYAIYDFRSFTEHHREKRDVTLTNNIPSLNSTTAPNNVSHSTPVTYKSESPIIANIDRPLVGVNGSGIRKEVPNPPKVSDPIQPTVNDFNMSAIFNEDAVINKEVNITKEDTHVYYNSTFINDLKFFQKYWGNLTELKGEIHSILSNSYRRATTLRLSFDFPFYGHMLRNITVATGGFIYMGEHVHSWLAATQYIAPLMANFDPSVTNSSFVRLYDNGQQFTVIWDKVSLQDNPNNTFTFAVTLQKNGDIVFAYKDIPIPIKNIDDKEHPVKLGISDAYFTDKIIFYVRKKTIYEYHRVTFMDYEIKNNTILKLTALPTCPMYDTCESCTNHQTNFNCTWCAQVKRCSSGVDRHKQDWMIRNCDKLAITSADKCLPSISNNTIVNKGQINQTTVYVTDNKNSPYHETVVKTDTAINTVKPITPTIETLNASIAATGTLDSAKFKGEATGGSSMAGAVAAFITIMIICSIAGWVLYAFRNPHTRSGQFLIKYRPSQLSWKRGEARYTAATIHM